MNMKSLSLSQPHLIILTGVKGSGKTHFAEKFAETFNAPYVSREHVAKLTPDDTSIEKIIVYQLGELLKTKQPLIVDGLGTTRTERVELTRKAREAGYETMLIWVQTDPITARGRAMKASKKQLTPEEYDRAAKRFTPPNTVEKPVVISGKHTYASQAKVILKKLTAPRAAISTHTTAPVRPQPTAGRRSITIR
jgi:predicted kinase